MVNNIRWKRRKKLRRKRPKTRMSKEKKYKEVIEMMLQVSLEDIYKMKDMLSALKNLPPVLLEDENVKISIKALEMVLEIEKDE